MIGKRKKKLNNIINSSKYSDEFIISRGEYYSALIYSKYLNYKFIDAKNYIIFNKNGKIDEKNTKNRLKLLNFSKGVVIGGFTVRIKIWIKIVMFGLCRGLILRCFSGYQN